MNKRAELLRKAENMERHADDLRSEAQSLDDEAECLRECAEALVASEAAPIARAMLCSCHFLSWPAIELLERSMTPDFDEDDYKRVLTLAQNHLGEFEVVEQRRLPDFTPLLWKEAA